MNALAPIQPGDPRAVADIPLAELLGELTLVAEAAAREGGLDRRSCQAMGALLRHCARRAAEAAA